MSCRPVLAAGQREDRQAEREVDVSGEHHAVRGQRRSCEDPGDDDDERPRHARQALEDEEPRQCDHPARQARQLPGGKPPHELRQQREEIAAPGVYPAIVGHCLTAITSASPNA